MGSLGGTRGVYSEGEFWCDCDEEVVYVLVQVLVLLDSVEALMARVGSVVHPVGA